MQTNPEISTAHVTWTGWFLWVFLAAFACLSVALINGDPLYYYDSVGYFDNGLKVLKKVGLAGDVLRNSPNIGGGDGGAAVLADDTLNASRSVVYSLLSAIVAIGTDPKLIPLFHTAIAFWAVGLPISVIVSLYPSVWSKTSLFALPLIVACAGALPFYVAYMMPDIFTGALLLGVATLTVFGRQMSWLAVGSATVLCVLAVVAHLSHLAIVALMVPMSLLIAVLMDRRRWWMPSLFICVILGLGLVERAAVSLIAQSVSGKEAVYYPFITGRIIQDGPGFTYLEENCPNDDIADVSFAHGPYAVRRSIPVDGVTYHFFGRPQVGIVSFLVQRGPAGRRFKSSTVFYQRISKYPFGTIGALLNNTFLQASMNNIGMTIPKPAIFATFAEHPRLPGDLIEQGNLSAEQAWIQPIFTFHKFVYAASLGIIAFAMLLPGRVAGSH